MRIEDIENEPYKLYKTADELVDELNDEFNVSDELDNIYMEYNELENENIIRKRKAHKILSKFSSELDKINKYPAPNFSQGDESSYFYTQIYLLVLSGVFMCILFYFQTLFAFLLFPIGIFLGDKYGIVERVNYWK